MCTLHCKLLPWVIVILATRICIDFRGKSYTLDQVPWTRFNECGDSIVRAAQQRHLLRELPIWRQLIVFGKGETATRGTNCFQNCSRSLKTPFESYLDNLDNFIFSRQKKWKKVSFFEAISFQTWPLWQGLLSSIGAPYPSAPVEIIKI